MEVILLERVAKLGQMGDVVRVKDGYARNYLLPQGKALRANAESRKRFEREKAQLEARNLEARKEAEGGRREARRPELRRHPPGRRDRPALRLGLDPRHRRDRQRPAASRSSAARSGSTAPIKTIGLHEVLIALHPEVEVPITINVARSPDEAERQARGEDLTRPDVRAGRGGAREAAAAEEAAAAAAEAEAAEPAKDEAE